MKILNLYAGIGGNRKLWGNEHDITAIEIDPKIAQIYQDNFPNDKVIVGDAHEYLLKHYNEYDFIWSSPPCPSHSRIRTCNPIQNPPIYVDMTLYQEIIFLTKWYKGVWVVENVRSYYKPLITPQECGKHYFWCNFVIDNLDFGSREHNKKNTIQRNCVNSELGLYIFKMAFKTKQQTLWKKNLN